MGRENKTCSDENKKNKTKHEILLCYLYVVVIHDFKLPMYFTYSCKLTIQFADCGDFFLFLFFFPQIRRWNLTFFGLFGENLIRGAALRLMSWNWTGCWCSAPWAFLLKCVDGWLTRHLTVALFSPWGAHGIICHAAVFATFTRSRLVEPECKQRMCQ